MARSTFNYQQLNSVARDPVAVEIIKSKLLALLEKYQQNIDPSSAAFKAVINTANDVWAGEDKDAFINNLTACAKSSSEQILLLVSNIKRYLPADLKDFEALQKDANKIASQKL